MSFKHEFQKGETVTFHAYEGEQIPARVVELCGGFGAPRYRLEGIKKPLITITTGRSIRESKHFVEPGEFVW